MVLGLVVRKRWRGAGLQDLVRHCVVVVVVGITACLMMYVARMPAAIFMCFGAFADRFPPRKHLELRIHNSDL